LCPTPAPSSCSRRLFYSAPRCAPPPALPSFPTRRSSDLYTDHGEVLPHGDENESDFNAYTGSVITDDEGLHHLFYTGQNPSILGDRKSTHLNSSHVSISYAVFCLQKKTDASDEPALPTGP